MPFVSQSQRGFMYANHPKMAAEFEAATPKGKKLPRYVGHGKKRLSHRQMAGANHRMLGVKYQD